MSNDIDYILAKQMMEERIRDAEKARRYAHVGSANRVSLFLKSLLSLFTRF